MDTLSSTPTLTVGSAQPNLSPWALDLPPALEGGGAGLESPKANARNRIRLILALAGLLWTSIALAVTYVIQHLAAGL